MKNRLAEVDGERQRESEPDANNHLQRCGITPLLYRVPLCLGYTFTHQGNKAIAGTNKEEIGNDSMRANDRKRYRSMRGRQRGKLKIANRHNKRRQYHTTLGICGDH